MWINCHRGFHGCTAFGSSAADKLRQLASESRQPFGRCFRSADDRLQDLLAQVPAAGQDRAKPAQLASIIVRGVHRASDRILPAAIENVQGSASAVENELMEGQTESVYSQVLNSKIRYQPAPHAF